MGSGAGLWRRPKAGRAHKTLVKGIANSTLFRIQIAIFASSPHAKTNMRIVICFARPVARRLPAPIGELSSLGCNLLPRVPPSRSVFRSCPGPRVCPRSHVSVYSSPRPLYRPCGWVHIGNNSVDRGARALHPNSSPPRLACTRHGLACLRNAAAMRPLYRSFRLSGDLGQIAQLRSGSRAGPMASMPQHPAHMTTVR